MATENRKREPSPLVSRFVEQFDEIGLLAAGTPVPAGATEIGFIGRDPVRGDEAFTVTGRVRTEGALRPFKVVSFFTEDNEYARHACRLERTLKAFDLNYQLQPVRSFGLWEVDCAFKARFLLQQWEASDAPIVWLDADATVEAKPWLFGRIDTDFAVHKWDGWQFGSGTLYFGKSELARRLLDQWVSRCDADPATWDQTHLQSAWCDVAASGPLRTVFLPRPYLHIFDRPANEPPVIKHWQASRKLKAEGRTTGQPQPAITAVGIEKRRRNQLWRTPEEAFWIREGTAHIIPNVGYEFPEGFDVGAALHRAIGEHLPVVEIGCGVGRIASLFGAHHYIGVDINPLALQQACAALERHIFRIAEDGHAYPEGPTALLYTVLLHVSDDALPSFLAQVAQGRDRIVIAEVMDARWRRDGDPPVFNRDPEEYILGMAALGFRLANAEKHAYARYDHPPWNVGRDSRLTILAFEATGRQDRPAL
jgi:SAM-dependent methyltransferase